MYIHGLQKMTLLDYPGKVACTVFLAGCDFRCPFCHNSDLLNYKEAPVLMDDSELLRFLQSRKGLLDGVCFTGGEPLMRPELPELLAKIKELGYPIKLDTNGNRPALLKQLMDGGLIDYVAMDIKNSPERYAATIGREQFDLSAIRESIELLKKGTLDYEFRTTVVKEFHDADSFKGIAKLIAGAKRYYLQCFTDRDSVLFAGLNAPEKSELEAYAAIVAPNVDFVGLRGV